MQAALGTQQAALAQIDSGTEGKSGSAGSTGAKAGGVDDEKMPWHMKKDFGAGPSCTAGQVSSSGDSGGGNAVDEIKDESLDTADAVSKDEDDKPAKNTQYC